MPEEKFNFTKAYQEIEGINEWFQGEEMDLDPVIAADLLKYLG